MNCHKTNKHPCFSSDAHHKYARMHLAVAPNCNISCNYCNRRFDCVNESRPGVSSEILTADGAYQKFLTVKKKINNLSVVGIAGPGDALANWDTTKQTIKLIKQNSPEIIFCLSTNGLELPTYASEIIKLGIKHVTVTINCLYPEIGDKIYAYVNYRGSKYTGIKASQILINSQLAGIKYLAKYGIIVKVNIVMIKDLNDFHIPEIVKKVKELGAFITNIMPLIPAEGSKFENFMHTKRSELNKMRKMCELELRQMYHCQQCRADAIGLLTNDRSGEFRTPQNNRIKCKHLQRNNYIDISGAS